MTQKYLIALAAELNKVRPTEGLNKHFESEDARMQWNRDVRAVATVAEHMNPRYDSGKFLKACGGLF